MRKHKAYLAVEGNKAGSRPKELFADVMEEVEERFSKERAGMREAIRKHDIHVGESTTVEQLTAAVAKEEPELDKVQESHRSAWACVISGKIVVTAGLGCACLWAAPSRCSRSVPGRRAGVSVLGGLGGARRQRRHSGAGLYAGHGCLGRTLVAARREKACTCPCSQSWPLTISMYWVAMQEADSGGDPGQAEGEGSAEGRGG